jgi:phosphoglycolate phosphatase
VNDRLEVRGGVLFDVDGTLLAGSLGHLGVLGDVLSRHIGRPVPIHLDGELPTLGETSLAGWVDSQVVRAVLRGDSPSPPDEAEVTAVMAAFEREYTPAAAADHSTPRVIDGVAACLERLAAAGIPMGLVTGNASFVARAKLAALGLERHFRFERDLGFGDWRADRSAVGAAAVTAMEREAGGRDRIAYVGDTPSDVRAAVAAGVLPVGVLTGSGTDETLTKAGAAVILRSVADIHPAAR